MSFDEAIILAIFNGFNDPKYLAEIFRVDLRDVLEKLKLMEGKGLIKCRESRILFFKRFRCNLTEEGFNTAHKVNEELQKRLNELKKSIEPTANPVEREAVIHNLIQKDIAWLYILPLLIHLNMLPLITIHTLNHYGENDIDLTEDLNDM
ncbi:MAG: hypothetical protein RMH77_07425 [Sulfolobales archaeon]|nr:hypothetical protein [Sulfolobales archaeon]MDW7970210.1 hypothetical protein [Sulfolobales archaeon]